MPDVGSSEERDQLSFLLQLTRQMSSTLEVSGMTSLNAKNIACSRLIKPEVQKNDPYVETGRCE
jgi:hypothetical protein